MKRRIAMTFPLTLGTPGGGTEDCLQLARHMSRAGAEIVPTAEEDPAVYRRPALAMDSSVAREARSKGIVFSCL